MKLVFDTTEIITLINRSSIILIECTNDDTYTILLDLTAKYQCQNIHNSEDKVIAIANAPFEIIVGDVIDSGDKDYDDYWYKWFTEESWHEFMDKIKTNIEEYKEGARTSIEGLFNVTMNELDELEKHPVNSNYVIKDHVAELLAQCQKQIETTVNAQFEFVKLTLSE